MQLIRTYKRRAQCYNRAKQIMENKNETQNRREFFKEAARKALPILGAVVLANSPIFAQVRGLNKGYCSSCKDDCTNGCSSGCSRSCKTDCQINCKGSSSTTLKGCRECENACGGGCKESCSHRCDGSCKGNSYKVS